jgi:hypothetical protein
MSENETHKTTGFDGLIEFGEYLNTLQGREDYTFSLPDEQNRLKSCPLDDVIRQYQEFFNGKGDTFRVWIGYNDYKAQTMNSKETTFTRKKQN